MLSLGGPLLPRDGNEFINPDDPDAGPPPITSFLVTLVMFFLIGSCFAAVLLYLRRRRRLLSRSTLPLHRGVSHQRQLTITTSANLPPSIQVFEEKRNLISIPPSRPSSPVPEIRITFPDEEDLSHQKKAPRVVVVRIGDTGSVGMAPIQQEYLPPYQSGDAERFHSLDLERMGGLKEGQPASGRWS